MKRERGKKDITGVGKIPLVLLSPKQLSGPQGMKMALVVELLEKPRLFQAWQESWNHQ